MAVMAPHTHAASAHVLGLFLLLTGSTPNKKRRADALLNFYFRCSFYLVFLYLFNELVLTVLNDNGINTIRNI